MPAVAVPPDSSVQKYPRRRLPCQPHLLAHPICGSLRPESLHQAATGPLTGPNLTGTVTALRYLGSGYRVTITTQGQQIAALLPTTTTPELGSTLTLTFAPAALHVMDEA